MKKRVSKEFDTCLSYYCHHSARIITMITLVFVVRLYFYKLSCCYCYLFFLHMFCIQFMIRNKKKYIIKSFSLSFSSPHRVMRLCLHSFAYLIMTQHMIVVALVLLIFTLLFYNSLFH